MDPRIREDDGGCGDDGIGGMDPRVREDDGGCGDDGITPSFLRFSRHSCAFPVIPAKAGIHPRTLGPQTMDPRVREDDGIGGMDLRVREDDGR